MAYFYALCAIALWSTNALTATFVLKVLPVAQVQFLQFSGAVLVFLILHLRQSSDKPQHGSRAAVWLLGLVGLVGTMIFQYIAFAIGPITEVNIIAYAWPLIAAIMVVSTGAAQRPVMLLTLAVAGFIGAGLVIGGDEVLQWNASNIGLAFASAVLSALCMAIYSFGIGRTRVNANDVLLPGAFAGLLIAAIWCFSGSPIWGLSFELMAGLYLGAGPMGLGYLFWSWAMQRDPNGNTALIGFLTPITSTGLLLSNGEMLQTTSLIGAVIVIMCCSVIGIQSRQPKNA